MADDQVNKTATRCSGTATKPSPLPALRRWEVVLTVDDVEVYRHGCRTKDAESAAQFALQVWMLGRDLEPYRGKTVSATPTEIEEES